MYFTNPQRRATIAVTSKKSTEREKDMRSDLHSIASKSSSLNISFTQDNTVIEYTLCSTDRDSESIYSLAVALVEDGVCTDSCYLYDISREKERAEEIFLKFATLGVSPLEAKTVLGEMTSPFCAI